MKSLHFPSATGFSALVLGVLLVWAPAASADDSMWDADHPPDGGYWADYQDPPETPRYRLSALVRTIDTTKAGIVDTVEGRSFFLAVGESEDGLHLIEARYDRESAIVQVGDERLYLVLDYGETFERFEEFEEDTPLPLFRGTAIEAFLRENPDAERKLVYAVEQDEDDPAPDGDEASADEREQDEHWLGEGIEAHMEKDADYRERARQPAVGRGEGIERFLEDPDRPLMPR